MSMPPPRPDECLFISYASEDRPVVREYVDAFAERGLRVWIDQQEIEPSDSIVARINEGIGGSQYAVVFHSEQYAQKVWTREEQAALVYAAIVNDERRVWVVVLDDAPLPPLLAHRSYRRRPDPVAFAQELGELMGRNGAGALFTRESGAAAGAGPTTTAWAALEPRVVELAARQVVQLGPQFLNSRKDVEWIELRLPHVGTLSVEIPVPAEHRESVADLASCLTILDTHMAFIRRLKEQIAQGPGFLQVGFEIELDRRLQEREGVRREILGYLEVLTSRLVLVGAVAGF
ncbi:MAG TPA: toll/interleukin-1 receptor domain-containing protein [Longimicrobium sp.]|nr:toll/interleukin-1 receptor domain-containing protein [Longimicrobium sp.]